MVLCPLPRVVLGPQEWPFPARAWFLSSFSTAGHGHQQEHLTLRLGLNLPLAGTQVCPALPHGVPDPRLPRPL